MLKQNNPNKNNRLLILFSLALILMPLLFLKTPLKIESDMMALLPKDTSQAIKQNAFDHLTKETSQKIIILFGSNSKEKSYEASRFFYENIKSGSLIENIDLELKSRSNDKLINTYKPFHNQLLSPQFYQLLKNNEGDVIQKNAIRDLYNPLSANIAREVTTDPFLLTGYFIKELPFFKSALFPYKDILMTQSNEKYYAFSTITVKENVPFSVNDLSDVMTNINEAKFLTKKQFENIEIITSGAAIHSYQASKTSIKEINIISFVSMMGILIMIYANFRSIKPFIFAMISIGVGFGAAFVITNFIFGEIHLLTIVFGASLIGVCEDYSMHYFAEFFNRKTTQENYSKEKILKHIYPGLLNGLLTTLVGYIALAFTPFPGLKQIACFASVGLVFSFLTVIIVFPKFYEPNELIYRSGLLTFSKKFLYSFKRLMAGKNIYIALFILISMSVIGLNNIKFNDDIRLLYSSPKKLLNQEIETRKILQQNIAPQFFLVKAKTQEELLQKEELLAIELEKMIQTKDLKSFQALSQIVPSIKRQNENLELVKSNLIGPYFDKHALDLGLSPEQKNNILKDLEQSPKYLEIKDVMRNKILNAKSLWIGNVNEKYVGIVLLNGLMNPKYIQKLVDEDKGIYLLNKIEDISKTFEKYRKISLFLLILVYFGVVIVLCFRYKPSRAIWISIPPLLAATCSISIISLLGYPINLFNILALFLVLGIGVDYSIFYEETNRNRSMNNNVISLAVLLSSATTILSFGLLAFSRFPFLKSFGLTVLIGITLSYLLSPLVTVKKLKTNLQKVL